MKTKLSLLLAVALLAALPAQAEIAIGIAGPSTGDNAVLGEQMRHGAEQAIADINAQGGINGEKLTSHFYDDACDPKQAVTVANKMVSANIKFVVGHACSGASIPASKVYNEEGVFMITSISSNPALTEAGSKTVFRVNGRDDQQGAVVADYILKHFKTKKVAILNDQSAWGVGYAEEAQKDLNKGGIKEIMYESFSPTTRDYSSLITKLKQAGAEIVLIGAYYTDVGLIVRQMKQQGTPMQVIGGDPLLTDQFWAITGDAGEGVLMSFGPDARNLPAAKPLLAVFRQQGYEPEGYTLYTYAAVQVLAEGIKRAGSPDPMLVATALRKDPVPSVLGSLSFDAKGDRSGSTYVMYQWHNGKYGEVQ